MERGGLDIFLVCTEKYKLDGEDADFWSEFFIHGIGKFAYDSGSFSARPCMLRGEDGNPISTTGVSLKSLIPLFNKTAKWISEEFQEASKQDPTIANMMITALDVNRRSTGMSGSDHRLLVNEAWNSAPEAWDDAQLERRHIKHVEVSERTKRQRYSWGVDRQQLQQGSASSSHDQRQWGQQRPQQQTYGSRSWWQTEQSWWTAGKWSEYQ